MKNTPRTEWAAFMLALALTSPLIWWSLDRRAPAVTIEYGLFPSTVKPGDLIYRTITIDRKRVCIIDPSVVIVDAERVHWRINEPEIVSPGTEGIESYKIPMRVPSLIALGEAELRLTIRQKCNPMHEFWPLLEIQPTLKFTVSSPDGKPQGQKQPPA